MRIAVSSEVIKRSVPEVFAYVADISTHTKWDPTCVEARYTSPPPIGVGSTYYRVDKFMGRRTKATGNVIAYEPNKKVTFTVPPPTPGEIGFMFEAADGGTRVSALYDVKLKGFFLVMGPLVPTMARRAGRKSFQNLKRVLESKG